MCVASDLTALIGFDSLWFVILLVEMFKQRQATERFDFSVVHTKKEDLFGGMIWYKLIAATQS